MRRFFSQYFFAAPPATVTTEEALRPAGRAAVPLVVSVSPSKTATVDDADGANQDCWWLVSVVDLRICVSDAI